MQFFTDFLKQEFHHVTVQAWTIGIAMVIAVAVALRLVRRVILHYAGRGEKQERALPLWYGLLIQCAHHTGWLFQAVVGLFVARYLVDIPATWDRRIKALCMVVFIMQAGLWASAVVDRVILAKLDRANGQGANAYRSARNLLRSVGLVVIWCGVLLLTFENLGVHVSALVAGLGVTGVAVAFATQNILSDLIASVSMLLDKPFLVGDFIVVEAYMGTVERIGVRTTRMRSLSGELIVMSNSDLAKSRIRNYKRMSERRVVFTFAVNYNVPAAKLRKIGAWVKEVIEAQPKTRFDRAHWLSYSDPGLVYECVFYVLSSDYNIYMDIQQEINLGILEKCQENDVAFAYGTQFKWIPQPEVEAPRADVHGEALASHH